MVDSIHIDPVHFDKYRHVIPGQFDTTVIQVKEFDSNSSLKGMFLMLFSFLWTPTKY